jgi:hypothetical protein
VQKAMPWAKESEQAFHSSSILKKLFDCIDWGILLMALIKFSFNNYWIN